MIKNKSVDTHITNLNHLIDIDNVVYPKVNVSSSKLSDAEDKKWFLYSFSSKVEVRGRNGETYFVPVIDRFKTDVENLSMMYDRFISKCKTVRDHYIAKEGKDVLSQDYIKIKNFKSKHIGDEQV